MSDAHHDDWFKHTAEEGAAQEAHGQINAPFIIGFMVMVIVITFALLFIILGYVRREVAAAKTEDARENHEPITREVFEAKTRWRSELEGDPRWINLEARTVRIPLDYAAREVVSMYQQNGQN